MQESVASLTDAVGRLQQQELVVRERLTLLRNAKLYVERNLAPAVEAISNMEARLAQARLDLDEATRNYLRLFPAVPDTSTIGREVATLVRQQSELASSR